MAVRAATATRRQEILDAALGLFAAQGLSATSIEDICSASGASNGSIYHHFGSKEGIAAALYAGAIEDYQRGAVAVFEQAKSAEEGYRGCVEHFLQWVADHRDLAVLMLAVEHSDVRQLGAEAVAHLNEGFAAAISEWKAGRRAAGDLPDIPDDLFVPAVLGPARRYAELWLRGRTATPISKAKKTLATLVWLGLASAVPGTPTAGL